MTQVPTRERLLDAAGDLFYKHGFQAVGLDQILETVGITKTAFYKHFASKDDLIVAILDQRDQREMEEWMAYIRIMGRDDARRQLEALFELLDDWFKNPEFRGCLFLNALTEFPSENDPINRAARKHGEHLAAAVMELATLAGAAEPGVLTEQIMMLVTGAIASRHRVGDLGAAKTAEAMAKVLITSQCGRGTRRA